MLKNRTMPVDSYFETFNANGDLAEFLPLLEHGPISVSATAMYLCGDEFVNKTNMFIITSQRAVEVFHECLKFIDESDPEIASKIRSKVGYTVGPATEDILRKNGFSDVRGGAQAGNGSRLADIIISDIGNLEQSIVFFTGEIRKDIIPLKLKAHGISVQEQVIYTTKPREGILKDFNKYCENYIDWLVFFSPQGTEDIVRQITESPELRRIKIASIGPTTEDYLRTNNIVPHVVAAKPTAVSLFDGLVQWRH